MATEFKFLNKHKSYIFNWVVLAHKTWIVITPPYKYKGSRLIEGIQSNKINTNSTFYLFTFFPNPSFSNLHLLFFLRLCDV